MYFVDSRRSLHFDLVQIVVIPVQIEICSHQYTPQKTFILFQFSSHIDLPEKLNVCCKFTFLCKEHSLDSRTLRSPSFSLFGAQNIVSISSSFIFLRLPTIVKPNSPSCKLQSLFTIVAGYTAIANADLWKCSLQNLYKICKAYIKIVK